MKDDNTRAPLHPALRHAKRVIVAIVGGTVILIGILLIVLPGPAFVVIPTGLAILAIEFEWSRRWLAKIRAWVAQDKRNLGGKTTANASSDPNQADPEK